MPEVFDLIVIGAGSGGLAAAKRAANYGAKVAIIERSRVGGTCVIAGCIPKKIMTYAAQMAAMNPIAKAYGFQAGIGNCDYRALCQRRTQIIAHLEIAHQRHLAAAKVTLLTGEGTIVDNNTVSCQGEHLQAKAILIATGSRPRRLACLGHELASVSDDFFRDHHQPRQALILGGGYIAIELACILHYLGTQVTLATRSVILKEFDSDIQHEMRAALTGAKINVLEHYTVKALLKKADGLEAELQSTTLPALQFNQLDTVIAAIGRDPVVPISKLPLQIQADDKTLWVNEYHQTNIANIYAVGDVIGKKNLTPTAIKAGRMVVDTIFNRATTMIDYNQVPTAVFGYPPISSVGLTEDAAQQLFGQDNVQTYKNRYYPLLFANTPEAHSIRSLQKMVVHRVTRKVLGMHMIGLDAPEIMQGFACCVQAGLTKEQLDATVAIHPTQAEELVLMR